MAWHTIEVSGMLAAYINLKQHFLDNPQQVTIEGISYDGDSVPDYTYKTHEFNFLKNMNANKLVTDYGAEFMRAHLDTLPENYTNDAKLNTAITDQMLKTFVRHFYGYEIGQENPEYWWVLLQSFFDQYLPIFILDYQQLIIENQAFITNLNHNEGKSHATGNANSNSTNSSIAGMADTPQDELNFALNTGDPAKDYNFNYSSNVNGSKGVGGTKQDNTNDQTSSSDSKGRNQTIQSLINQLEGFANGVYVNLFEHAIDYRLFMETVV